MPGASPPLLQFDRVSRHYGEVTAVDDVSLSVERGEFVALVGASGSGKSTLLKTVNRLVEPTAGRVLLEGADVTDGPAPALRHRIGYVFQGIGLFTHMSVAQNIALVPRLEGRHPPEGRIADLLQLVDLDPAMAGRYPDALSGGQRQRVGVARALAGEPPLLLMDEPFGALDPVTRDALGERVKRLHAELGLTTVMVTHDMAEALLLGTRVLVMDGGRIVADATPRELLAGGGGDVAQALVAVPRAQARALADLT
ncbi:ATP-binding cassette domain-containing protein [Aurantiacibacter spongiae]|uniref:ATP-binding cassette domain-containing protein n=1 Tax=Aurantiacibacter spongiae TaxID=2488860 RepID=A0A3N5DAA5_9SPHN|nr:ATP-binding cassette domain-containing protein [Aurantiacibacter spongiae]RPF71598.1 ATP-binding cassette domain-containing protein [Aurantiacibacter spongiae]